jgi:hypothetical protein
MFETLPAELEKILTFDDNELEDLMAENLSKRKRNSVEKELKAMEAVLNNIKKQRFDNTIIVS